MSHGRGRMLEHLFDAELQYRPGMEPIHGASNAAGDLVGSGDGTVAGPALAGTLRWTLYESPGELLCRMDPRAEIETHDGGRIRLEARGYALRPAEHQRTWTVAAALRFETDDERYRWLTDALGVWEGEFDAAAHRARYRAYVQREPGYAALEAAGVRRERRGGRRTAALTSGERDLYRWILRRFATGGRPAAQALREEAERLGVELKRALKTLAREDLVHLGDDGEIAVAYPFSGRRTAHGVRFASGHKVFAMCAIDALGIAPMLDEPIEIVSRDPRTAEEIRVDLAPDGTGEWQPKGAVVVAGGGCAGASFTGCCPVLNFFASSANAEAWLAEHPNVSGRCISMADAIEAGRVVFGEALA